MTKIPFFFKEFLNQILKLLILTQNSGRLKCRLIHHQRFCILKKKKAKKQKNTNGVVSLRVKPYA